LFLTFMIKLIKLAIDSISTLLDFQGKVTISLLL
jgi:hypothetical protein